MTLPCPGQAAAERSAAFDNWTKSSLPGLSEDNYPGRELRLGLEKGAP